MKGFTKDRYLEVIILTSDYNEYAEMYSEEWTQREAINDLMERVKLEPHETITDIYVKRTAHYEPKYESEE